MSEFRTPDQSTNQASYKTKSVALRRAREWANLNNHVREGEVEIGEVFEIRHWTGQEIVENVWLQYEVSATDEGWTITSHLWHGDPRKTQVQEFEEEFQVKATFFKDSEGQDLVSVTASDVDWVGDWEDVLSVWDAYEGRRDPFGLPSHLTAFYVDLERHGEALTNEYVRGYADAIDAQREADNEAEQALRDAGL